MRGRRVNAGAFQAYPVDVDDTSGEVSCSLIGCDGMALQRLVIAGHPAGFVCCKHAREWGKLWRELTAEPEEERLAA